MANLIKNKYILTIATVVIFGLTIALGSLYAKDRIERNDILTESDAVKFAYVDAGISPKTAPSYEAKLLKEDGIYVYKVVISSEDIRYKYTIAANNGEVISSESAQIAQNKKDSTSLSDTTDVEENAANNNDSNKADPSEKNGKNVISNAKSKDKPNANKTTDNQTTGSKLENDVAENDKPTQGKSDVKNVADNESNNTSSGKTSTVSETIASRHYISMDKAKSITLKDAGLRPSFVTFEKALLKKDDGKIIYEIEFFTSTYEYEYEVDAYTGAILSKDVDSLSPSDKAEKVKENSSNSPKNADLEDYEKKHDKDDDDDDKKKDKDDDDDDD